MGRNFDRRWIIAGFAALFFAAFIAAVFHGWLWLAFIAAWALGTYAGDFYATQRFRDSIRIADRQIDNLRAVLLLHHEWHLAQSARDEYGIVPADEYQDSAMCERTLAVLG